MVETLLLSAGYEPVDRIRWQRAITLWWTDKVDIVSSYEDRSVAGVDFTMPMPAVVRARRYSRVRRLAPKMSRSNVFARDGGRCQYCGAQLRLREATYDHVVPRAAGGRTSWTNIVIACAPCNRKKGARTPEQAGMKLRSRPVRPARLPGLGGFAKDPPEAWKAFLPAR